MNHRLIVFVLLIGFCKTSFSQSDPLKFKHYQPYMWMVGIGGGILDNDGRPGTHLLDFEKKLLTPTFPNHVFVDRYIDYGLSFEASLSFSTFESMFLDNETYPKRSLFALDVSARYSFYDKIPDLEWFDPYVGAGLGITHWSTKTSERYHYTIPMLNILAGINFWIGDFGTGGDFGIRTQANLKFGLVKNYRFSDISYRQYTISLVYRFELGEKKDDSFKKPKYKWVHDAPKEDKPKKQKKSE